MNPAGPGHGDAVVMPHYFFMGRKVQLLFWEWAPGSGLSYALTLAAVLILAVFYEWFGELRRRSLVLLHSAPRHSASKPAADEGSGADQRKEDVWPVAKIRAMMRWQQVQLAVVTLAYVMHTGVGYVVMLVVMSFNAGVFLSVLAGLALGFYLFRVTHLTHDAS